MDFARSHILEESIASKSKIRYITPPDNNNNNNNNNNNSNTKHGNEKKNDGLLDAKVVKAANRAAQNLLLGPSDDNNNDNEDNNHHNHHLTNSHKKSEDPRRIDASLYPERMTPLQDKIQSNDLVVIFESFDNLKFVYAQPGQIFSNRNGHFHHDDFIGKPFGCKIRSRNNRGYGFVFLLKPTPELWARSLNHRTQIVHELDASMIVFYLNLRPNMVVCESGTGSGAMSHAILRTIAPEGRLHTFEFNKMRAETARHEFQNNGVSHLVQVHHRDVCGKVQPQQQHTTANDATASMNDVDDVDDDDDDQTPKNTQGGFGLPGRSVSAIFLDLPEPWLAIPHAAYTLKANGRLASYSPCIEQTQRVVAAMSEAGFHSIQTLEFRRRENYVDEVEYELPPKEKRPRVEPNPYLVGNHPSNATDDNNDHDEGGDNNNNNNNNNSGGEDTGAEADNEKSELSETEADQLSLATAGTAEEMAMMDAALAKRAAATEQPPTSSSSPVPPVPSPPSPLPLPVGGGPTSTTKASASSNKAPSVVVDATAAAGSNNTIIANGSSGKRSKKMLVARPAPMMRGHTAFLTFATAGNVPKPDPNKKRLDLSI